MTSPMNDTDTTHALTGITIPPSSGVVAVPGLVVAGRFDVGALIAIGGMSLVHRGLDRELGMSVILKFLSPHLHADPDARARFEREPRILARLAAFSDGFVRPLAAGMHEGLLYLVTEALDGETLAEAINRGPLPLADVIQIVRDVARSLATAHQLGIVHRDVKPENLFRVVRDGECRIRVLDVGIAKQIDRPGVAAQTDALGTPLFMAPEALREQPIGPWVDTWGLAAVAYYALAGRAPFFAPTLLEVMQIVCASDASPPPLAMLVPGLPASLDAFFERAFTRDPARRFATIEAFADAFEVAAAADVEGLGTASRNSARGAGGG